MVPFRNRRNSNGGTGEDGPRSKGVAGGKETERQLSRFQNLVAEWRVRATRFGGHPCDLRTEELTGRPPGSARAGWDPSPNLDSKARGEGTPDPDQPRNREAGHASRFRFKFTVP